MHHDSDTTVDRPRAGRLWRGLLALALGLGTLGAAQAVPSYARQTGMDCAGCHVGAFGPQLTPAGIRFKLGGYTDTDGQGGKIPLSGMAVFSATHTDKPQNPAPDHLKSNNNVTMDEASLFIAGRLAEDIGTFLQITHSGIDHSTALDQMDLRYAHTLKLGDKDTILGVSVHNNPTVQDPFNSSPVWSGPFIASEAGFGTGEAASLINGGLEGRVIGVSGYGFWNDTVYGELGTYRSLSPTGQKRIGLDEDTQRLGGNVYGRLAWFGDQKSRAWNLGVFGWQARLAPDRGAGTPRDRYTDLGIDGSYQLLGTREHVWTFNGSAIRERRTAGDTGERSHLHELRLNTTYHYQQTWGGSLGLFSTRGSDPAAKTTGQVLQVDWTPWGKESASAPEPFGWANVRFGAQYWRYGTFGGTSSGAHDHDTLYLFAWTAF